MHPLGEQMGIIGMSGDDYAKEWYDAGADYFFSKTRLDPFVLEESIAHLIEQYRSSRTLRS
jgi:hypothetical protein